MVQSDTIYMITLLIFLATNLSFSLTATIPQACTKAGAPPIDLPGVQYRCNGPTAVLIPNVVVNCADSSYAKNDALITTTLSSICADSNETATNTARKEIREECKDYSKELREACRAAGISGNCTKRLKDCGEARPGADKAKKCKGITDIISKEDAEDTLDSAKEDFESSETKLQDLQEKLVEAQEDAIEKQQSTEEKITALQEKLAQIPTKAQELALKNEAERDKTLLTHIDNLNKVSDDLQSITDALHDAESQLINKRNELLTTCELEARGKQQAKIAEKNQKKSVGKNTVKSLSEAIQSTYTTTQDGKKVLRNTKEIVQRFERCQKTRMHQTGIQAAERNYQRTLIALESKRKSIEKQQNSMEARLEASLRMNNKASELEMASLVQEQAAMQNQVLMLQKQVLTNQQQSQSNISQIQQDIQKAQFEQYQKQQSMFSAIGMSNASKQKGSVEKDDIAKIGDALGYFSTASTDGDLDEDDESIAAICADKAAAIKLRAKEASGDGEK